LQNAPFIMPEKNNKSGFLVNFIIYFIIAFACAVLYHFLTNRQENKPVSIVEKSALDSLSITRWDVIPQSNMNQIYTVFEDSNVWKIRLQDHDIVDADLGIVTRALRHFTKMDSAKLVKMDKAKWKTEGIDDNGTRVIVYEGSQIAGRFIVGKMEFMDQYKASYYFRRINSDSVYLLKETYLDGSILAPDHNFRKRALDPVNPYYYKTVKVISPDTNVYYLLENVNGVWSINGRNINQNKVNSYIKMLSMLQVPEFEKARVSNPPEASVTIDTKFGQVVLAASKEPSGNWVLGSSVNIGNRIALNKAQVYAVFPPMHYFTE